MKDKLAELRKQAERTTKIKGITYYHLSFTERELQKYAEAYHESKMKEVTDEDIFVVADKKYPCYDESGDRITDLNEGFIEGAKALRDGEIKHNREV